MRAARLIRVVLTAVTGAAGSRALWSGRGRPGETFADRPMMQQYGFASRPKESAQGIALQDGANTILICTEDAQYRLALEDGEVGIYSDEGDAIHLKRGRTIRITAGTKVIVAAPAVEFTGDLVVAGNVTADGTVWGKTEVTGGALQTKLTTHVHTSGGPGSPTTPPTPGT